ncbi:MAG TPA: hypothetical protein PLY97_06615 [Acidocella sp.]|nr:hypothetical protein [Acidocella sp.]
MRIQILFAEPGDAFLTEGPFEAPNGAYAQRFTLPKSSHQIGCACCAPRGPASQALAAMFRARATGVAPYFKSVTILASPAGEDAVRAALEGDVLTAARYRL